MTTTIDDALVTAWVTGWARCRSYPVRQEGTIIAALRTTIPPEDADTAAQAVGEEHEEWEYVVANPGAEVVRAVVETVSQNPRRLLTVVTDVVHPPEPVGAAGQRLAELTGLSEATVGEKLMVADIVEHDVEPPIIPDGYEARVDRNDGWTLLTFVTTDEHSQGEGLVAARGRVAMVDHYAVFDRIWTFPEFRRQGLGTLMMRYLTALALEHEVTDGLLVAGLDGQALYGFLGWNTIADVTVLGAAANSDPVENPSHIEDPERIEWEQNQ